MPALAAALAALDRRVPACHGCLRHILAVTLLLDAAAWYGYLAFRGWLTFPENLPLELCDATLCLTIITLFTRNPLSFDVAYYGALAGTSMAVLTPDLWEPFPSYGTVQFFIAHGLVIVGILFLVWSRQARPRPRSVWRALLGINGFAAVIAIFNLLFGTNYMYLRAKPQNPSLLDILGPWPWYLLVSEFVALGLFLLLYLPFRGSRSYKL